MKIWDDEEIIRFPEIDKKEFESGLYTVKNLSENVKFNMVLQIHITDYCNLRCTHCYGTKQYYEMNIGDFKNVIEQYFNFLRKHRLSSMINITGGEPFVHKNFYEIMEVLYTYWKKNYPFMLTILTNGTLFDEKCYEQLNRYSKMIYEFQISLDGMEDTHDKIRGDGNFKISIRSIKTLLNKGYRVSISFVISKMNYFDALNIVRLGENIGVYRITISRLIPIGKNDKENQKLILSNDEYKNVQNELYKLASEMVERINKGMSHTYLLMQRCDLWHLADVEYIKKASLINGLPSYLMLGCSCKVGVNLIVIMPNLDVVACRRLPIVLGNLKSDNLSDIFLHSEILREFRSRREKMKGKCKKCEFYYDKRFRNICNGGGPCMAVALGKTIYDPDPMCWYIPEQ